MNAQHVNKTQYKVMGTAYFPSTHGIAVDRLPIATYRVMFNPDMGFYLELSENLQAPAKLYGDVRQRAERVLHTFEDRPSGTGVLLTGTKGSGKSMFAREISVLAKERGIITILVNHPYAGEAFNVFLQAIDQPAVLMFDEFEKVYIKEEGQQDPLLTLFDGQFNEKRLFLVTANDVTKLSDYFLNRPGRFFYRFDYTGLEEAFIREYATDVLRNKDHAESVVNLSSVFEEFNFDMLKGIVEEMNRYDETAREAIRFFNAEPDTFGYRYKVTEFEFRMPEKNQLFTSAATTSFNIIPMLKPFTVSFSTKKQVHDGDEDYGGLEWEDDTNHAVMAAIAKLRGKDVSKEGQQRMMNKKMEIQHLTENQTFNPSHIISFSNGVLVMDNGKVRITLEKEPPFKYDYRVAL